MQEKNKVYKEGELVKVLTNKCNVHLMEMFGHSQFNPDEIGADEYVAQIRAVIGKGLFYAVTVFDTFDFYIRIDPDEIIGPADIDDLPEDKRDKVKWKNPVRDILYEPSEENIQKGLSGNTKRITLAISAVEGLHPGGTIRVVEISPNQSFLREAIYNELDDTLNSSCLSPEHRKELEEKKSSLLKWCDTLHFEEHYEYHIGVDESNSRAYDNPELVYYIVAVNEDGSKAYVMHTRDDQTLFFKHLGPDFQNMYMEVNYFKDSIKRNN